MAPAGGAAARARVHRPARVDDRRHAVDGLHPVRRVRVGLPLDGGRPAVHRSGGAGQGLPLRRRPARRPAPRAPQGPRRGPARDLRLHPLLQLHRGVPQGRGADEPDHAPAPRSRAPTTASRTATTATATSMRSSRTSGATASCTRPTCCRTPTAASSTRARCPSCFSSLPVDHARRCSARKMTPGKALLHPHKAPKDVKRIFEQVEGRERALRAQPLRRRHGGRRGHGRHEGRGLRRGPDAEGGEEHAAAAGASCPRRGARTREGRLLARLREPGLHPELHGSMAKVAPLLDIELVELDRASCCGRRRDRRAQPGARRHAERAHVRARPAGDGRRRRADDEHLLDLPGRAERVPGAPRRERRVPRPRQRDARARGPALREGHHQQALPVADGRGDRPRRDRGEGQAAADRPAGRPVLRLLHRAPHRPRWGSTASIRATATCSR